LRTRRGRCVNGELCPLSRANETFSIEEGKRFVCPLCEQGLVEFAVEGAELSSAAAEFREDVPARAGMMEEPLRDSRPKMDWPFQIDFSNISASEEFLRDDRFSQESQPSSRNAPAIRTFDASEHASWSEGANQSDALKPNAARVESTIFQLEPSAGTAEQAATKPEPAAVMVEPVKSKPEAVTEDVPEEPMFKAFYRTSTESVPLVIVLIVIFLGLLIAAGFLAVSKKWIVLPGFSSAVTVQQKIILRFAGSNMVGDSLMPALAEAFLKAQGATGVRTVAGAKPNEQFVQGVMPGDTAPSQIAIDAQNSARAFTSLAENSSDIGMAARRINPMEEGALKTLGDAVSPENEHILGFSGIAVVVSPSNPLRELAEDKIIKILVGEVSKWSSVGSPEGAIQVYVLDDKSGSNDTPSALLLGSKLLTPRAKRMESSEALSNAIASDRNGIGVVNLPLIGNAKALAVSGQDTQALKPSHLTIATQEYLLTRQLYLYTHGGVANKFTQAFLEFALSQAGQELVAAQGFVSRTIGIDAATVAQNAPQQLRKLTSSAQRVSLDFRFPENVDQSGSDAQADLDRVAKAIADLQVPGENLMLFGFSDNGASSKENFARSLAGAKMLEVKLASQGLAPKVILGFGPALPIAPNDTEEGRRKNRRVEIWVKKK